MAHNIPCSSEMQFVYTGDIKEIKEFFERCIGDTVRAEVTIDASGRRLTQNVLLNSYSHRGRPSPSEVRVGVTGDYKPVISTTPPEIGEPFWATVTGVCDGTASNFVYSWEPAIVKTMVVFVVTHRGDNVFVGVYGTRQEAEASLDNPIKNICADFRISECRIAVK